MSKSVSICIPTYKRPDLLEIALKSCFAQSQLPLEILIGDDSPDMQTQEVVESIARSAPVSIVYFHNLPGLGQAANVHSLIQRTRGELISVLHDDDKLEPDAIKLLSEPFSDSRVVASYGKQFLMSEAGEYDFHESVKANIEYFRTSEREGLQSDATVSAILHQFPNDGYLVSSELAKAVGYLRAGAIGGDACDFVFGMLVAKAARDRRFYFVNEYTSAYRLSESSVSNRGSLNNAGYRTFKYSIEQTGVCDSDPAVVQHFRNTSITAISQAINLGIRRDAAKWYFSKWNWHRIPTLAGLKLLIKLILPQGAITLLRRSRETGRDRAISL